MTLPLDADWNRLRHDPAALRRAAAWGIVAAPVATLDDVLTAVGYEQPASVGADRNLRRLVAFARDDDVATHVVVRRLLPGMLCVAARQRRRGCPDAVSEALGALWIAVRTYDPRRSPSCIAAALIGDVDYRAFRAGRRRRGTELLADALDERPAREPDPDPAAEVAELLATAVRAGTPPDDIDLLRRLLADPSPQRVAAVLDLNERTVRKRRDRLAALLRELALQAA
mgnify:CR=1 FL=1